VFSLGCVLWEVLTHQRLFEAMNDAAVRMAVQERDISPPSEINANVPAELSAICMRALQRNGTDRYQSLKAMAVEIEEFLEEAGYADDDTKIASYLATMNEPPKQVKIAMPPLARPASSTEPPPVSETATTQPIDKLGDKKGDTQPPPSTLKQPAAPSMLGEPPKQEDRAKRPSGGEALAAALANAGGKPSNGSASGLPPAKHAATAVGVPKLDEWQDGATAAPAHASPPAAAPVGPVDAAAASAVTPLPPVLPSGSTTMRDAKSTISVSVPPQVKVATVEAKHVEAKQPALIVDDNKATLVDSKLPDFIIPKLDDGKPAGANPSAADTLPVAPKSSAEAPKHSASSEAPTKQTRAKSQSEGGKRTPSQSDAVPVKQGSAKSAPHPVGAVSLGPGPRGESKDVLAGWGWGTDKHTAIPPEGYAGDDDYDFEEPSSHKMLVKIIGTGMGVVALIIILAFAFGGSKDKKKATTAAKQPDTTRTVVDQPPPPPPAPVAEGSAAPGSAEAAPIDPYATAGSGGGSAAIAAAPGSAAPTEAEKAAAAKAEADRLAAEKAAADAAETERVAAEKKAAEDAKKSEAERLVAEKKQAEETKKAEAEAKKAEATRVAAEQKQADEAKKAEAAEKRKADQAAAAAKKAEAARIAAEKAEAKKAEQQRLADARKAEAAKKAAEMPKTPKPPKKAETKVATAEPKKAEGKMDVETAYRVGLQQFARGDTSGALASLRTSLAGNPNYAPTWRGLGLVFEKLGEKDQARAAYKRYLQLAPGAGDAEQIKGRLERLGT
jgi:Flp pilus assembly protein TadD